MGRGGPERGSGFPQGRPGPPPAGMNPSRPPPSGAERSEPQREDQPTHQKPAPPPNTKMAGMRCVFLPTRVGRAAGTRAVAAHGFQAPPMAPRAPGRGPRAPRAEPAGYNTAAAVAAAAREVEFGAALGPGTRRAGGGPPRRGLLAAAMGLEAATAVAPAPETKYRKDYAPPAWLVPEVRLEFALREAATVVKGELRLRRNTGGDLELDGGKDVELRSVAVDGAPLPAEAYERTAGGLTIKEGFLPAGGAGECVLAMECLIDPQANTSLDGLYMSGGNFCTQCEAQGFRNIIFYPDRPDVMAKFTTRMEADKAGFPVLLGNGNLVEAGDLEGGRHFAEWEDPWVKPAYLFALVAGDLGLVEDAFTTRSGKEVALKIYVNRGMEGKCDHAMESLKKSMAWDEEAFGLEYDLNLFNIVAVSDFNMGAMENKSLNIFNSRLVLASPETATDTDYERIEGVIGHEYFHNWTGNRVTCRDWFQLTLKEGLTVYRDQEFSSDMNSRPVKRISEVSRLRAAQFAEDSGPMAHPVRPDSYIKMDNFYTVTVYSKGAEVVRMYRTLLGVDGFRKGMDLYFERHDGQAVTCDDFLAAMADANGADLSALGLWYGQAGTPVLTVETAYDAAAQEFTLTCRQAVPPTAGQAEKVPVMIPLAMALLGPDGAEVPLTLGGEALGTSTVLPFAAAKATYTFTGVEAAPVLSILRDFSAPVKLEYDQADADLAFLFKHDQDPFNRWEAGQRIFRKDLLGLIRASQESAELALNAELVGAVRSVLTDPAIDPAFAACAITLPGKGELNDLLEVADPDAVDEAHGFLKRGLAAALEPELAAAVAAFDDPAGVPYSFDAASCARRALKNTALGYLATLKTPEVASDCLARVKAASNMTDQVAALACLANHDCAEREAGLAHFYEEWKEDELVMLKWLGLQAGSNLEGNVANVRALKDHPAFQITNPNCCYTLFGGFAGSPKNFHNLDGSGYEFLGDAVIEVDKLNGQVGARIVGPFTRWKRYGEDRQALMKAQLERILAVEGLSENVYEIVSKSLDV